MADKLCISKKNCEINKKLHELQCDAILMNVNDTTHKSDALIFTFWHS